MTAPMNDWQRLGLEGPCRDITTIKRAYARQLRTTRPDDDAAAYQALREAYDRTMQWARESDCEEEGEQHRAEPAGSDGESQGDQAAPAASASPKALCDQVAQTLLEQGGAAALASMPDMMRQLNLLPLGAQEEASVRFADIAIQMRDVPAPMVAAWRDHFGWADRDFRVERLMGALRMHALTGVLANLALIDANKHDFDLERLLRPSEEQSKARARSNVTEPVRDPEVLRRFTEVLQLHRLIQGRAWTRAILAAALRDETIRAQWTALDSMLTRPNRRPPAAIGRDLLAGLGLTVFHHERVRDVLAIGRGLRAICVFAALVAVAWLQGSGLGRAILTAAGAMAVGTLCVILAILVLIGANRLRMSLEARTDTEHRRPQPVRRKRSVAWGSLCIALGTAGMVAAGPLKMNALYGLAIPGVLFGAMLAMPDTLDECLVLAGTLLYAHLVLGGLPAPALVLLAAWLSGGMHLWRRGTFSRWQEAVSGDRRKRAQSRPMPLVVAAMSTVVPVLFAWITERCGGRLILWSTLVAFVTHVHAPASLPVGSRLLLLPACLALGLAVRKLAHRLGQRLMPRETA